MFHSTTEKADTHMLLDHFLPHPTKNTKHHCLDFRWRSFFFFFEVMLYSLLVSEDLILTNFISITRVPLLFQDSCSFLHPLYPQSKRLILVPNKAKVRSFIKTNLSIVYKLSKKFYTQVEMHKIEHCMNVCEKSCKPLTYGNNVKHPGGSMRCWSYFQPEHFRGSWLTGY